jgi:hypothetical protein
LFNFDKKAQAMKRPGILLIILLSFSSCGILYVPNKLNTPFINDKNQMEITFSREITNYNAQVALSKINHFALIGSFSATFPKDTTDSYFRLYSLELGAGYYKRIKDKVFWNAFAGMSYTTIKEKDIVSVGNNQTFYYTNSRYPKSFIQTSFGYKSDYFGAMLTTKFNYIMITYSSTYSYDYPNPFRFFDTEVALSSFIGAEPLYLNLQIGYAIMQQKYAEMTIPFFASLGLTFKF